MGEWLRRASGVNGSKGLKKKKNGAAGVGENWGPLKSENDLEGVNFFFEIDPDPGGHLRVGRGGSGTIAKKPDGFSRV